MEQKTFPIADLHCDLLAYLAESPQAKATSSTDIGCSIPRLREGRVGIQVLAIYSAFGPGSTRFAAQQVESYCRLLSEYQSELGTVASAMEAEGFMSDDRIGVVAAIENASGLCEEEEALDRCFERLDNLIERIGSIFYISLTHNDENRFGG
jgi:membrane dipeptidase